MANILPLIPQNKATCKDVRPVLQEVFRNLDAQPVIANVLKRQQSLEQNETTDGQRDKSITEDISQNEKLQKQEKDLKKEYAKRLQKIYTVKPDTSEDDVSNLDRKKEFGIVQREDLMPNIFEDINQQRYQWMKNALTKKSETSSSAAKISPSLKQSNDHMTLAIKHSSLQSISYDEPVAQPPMPLQQLPSWPRSPHHVVCEPSRLDFVNFIVGHTHTRQIRVVNLSKNEMRLSVQPPSHPEIEIDLMSSKGLKLTSMSMIYLRVRFTPRGVCAFQDELIIRSSVGSSVIVPISCLMVPPLLDVIVPYVEEATSFLCSDDFPTNNDILDLGARLLGEVHRVHLQLQCNVDHASFYIMTEEAWCLFLVDQEAIKTDVLVVGAFCISPVRWNGSLSGMAYCRAPTAGVRTIALRVLSSTAVVRPLHVVADAVMFSPEHVTLKTSEKDYDIFSEGDPNCLHYVHLGTAFPHQSLSSAIHLINNSSVPYSYYWSVRRWDIKFNPKESEELSDCFRTNFYESDEQAVELLSVERMRDVVSPRSSVVVRICAAKAERPGKLRGVLMLILTSIPRECISPEHEDMVLSKETIEEKCIPGLCKAWSRSICQVLCTQIEVWWEVVPVRFILQPSLVNLTYSTRLKSIEIPVEVTQLKGSCCVWVQWSSEEGNSPSFSLSQSQTVCTTLKVPLPNTRGAHFDIVTYQLKSVNGERCARCSVTRHGYASLAKLGPRICWLNTHPPSTCLATQLVIINDTPSAINWNARTYEWYGDQMGEVCPCDILRPLHGSLVPNNTQSLDYKLHASGSEHCILRLVELQQYEQQTRRRTTLVGCRSLQPRVLLRILHYNGTINDGSEICKLEENTRKGGFSGVALVRPLSALTVGSRSRFLLSCTNITPVATTIYWDKLEDCEQSLRIKLVSDHIEIGPYATVTIEVCLEAIAVCRRQLWVQRAGLLHSEAYLYLVIDAAIDGRKVTIDIPLKGRVDGVTTITRLEHGAPLLRDASSPAEILIKKGLNDVMFKSVEKPQWAGDCPCYTTSEGSTASTENLLCIEFTNVNINTEVSQHVTLRNEGAIPMRWEAAVLPETSPRPILNRLGHCVLEPEGMCLRMRCVPASGQLPLGGVARIEVSVIAGSWGVYKAQLILQIENMEPVILDVWVEAIGWPLRFALKPNLTIESEESPIIWMSMSDPERRLHVTNTSCADILMYICVLREHDNPKDLLPFRLYLRFFDTPRAFSYEDGYVLSFKEESPSTIQNTCRCQNYPSTGIELFLCEDHGKMDEAIFQVEPTELSIGPGENASQVVRLICDEYESTRALLLVRTRPLHRYGSSWYRPDAPHQIVRLRVYGRACLQLSCETVQVKISALHLPPFGITRARNYFQALNVGDGVLTVKALTKSPWSICLRDDTDEKCLQNCRKNSKQLLLSLPPWSSVELCAAFTLPTCEAWPASAEDYPPSTVTTTQLNFYDSDNVQLARIPLNVILEFPKITVAPAEYNFGPIARGDARKTYFIVYHTSTLGPLELVVIYEGDCVFTVSPKRLTLLPNCSGRFYVQYIASGWIAEASGIVRVCAIGLEDIRNASGSSKVPQSLGDWCTAYATLRATSTADRARALPPHDSTDDTVLLPKDFIPS